MQGPEAFVLCAEGPFSGKTPSPLDSQQPE